MPQAKGEKLACFGLTEPGAGSDVAAMRTTARREGDAYVLNGQKNWISYATVADHALVFAKTDPAAKHKGISAFVLERGMPGFTTADTEHKLGIWAGSTGELFFENVEVPAENLVGEGRGQGFEIAMYGLDQGRFTVAAGACGVIRACLERSVEYARERETFGQPIGKYQFVQDMIAEMVLGYETSKLLVMQAAWMKDEGAEHARDLTGEVARDRVGLRGGAPRDPGARRVRLLGRVRDRALLPQRAGADHLRGHDADPQDDAGRARARVPEPERPRRRRLADRRCGQRPALSKLILVNLAHVDHSRATRRPPRKVTLTGTFHVRRRP